MKNRVAKVERSHLKLLVVIGGVLLLAIGGWGAFRAYHAWQERHLVRRAAAVLSGGDAKAASLSARRAFQINPQSAAAARILAQIAERSGDGTELEWRRKVFELQPRSIDDALALVRCALRANDLRLAEKTLRDIAPIAQQIATYHAALGRLAEMRGRPDEAETHWARAAELAPAETAYQVQAAMVQLGAADETKRAHARAVLERLRADPKQRAAATRALIIDGAARQENAQRLRTLAAELQSYPEATFQDRILYLEILRQLRDPEFDAYLANLEEGARANATDLAAIISWLATNGNTAEAQRLAGAADPELARKWPMPLAVAESYAKANDWAGLQRIVGESKWERFEFLRRAYLARALRAQQQQLAADQQWAHAQKEVSAQPQALLLLARTVAGWEWQNEALDLLWTLSKAAETQKDALQMLYQHYAKTGDTGGLYRVLSHSTQIAPDDLKMQNNLAQIALLLGVDTERARKIAAELARKEPANAAFVSTHAFALYLEGEKDQALQLMRTLPKEQLQVPAIAAYYGIILAAAGEKELARTHLERGSQAFLLPEEKALIVKAQSAIR